MEFQVDNDIPLVPWSRHMVKFPKPVHPKNTEKNKVDLQLSDYKKRQLVLAGRIRAISESSLAYERPLKPEEENHDTDGWDSKSDPGSSSPNVKSFQQRGKKLKKPIQGRSSGHSKEFRRRNIFGLQEDNTVGGNEEFVVEIPMEPLPAAEALSPSNWSRNYVDFYIDFMYYCCLTPHRWQEKDKHEKYSTAVALSIIQKVVFCYIVLMSTFSSFNLIKYFVLEFLVKRSMNNFIDLGYFTVCGVLQAYLTYFLAFRQNDLSLAQHEEKMIENGSNKDKLAAFRNKVIWITLTNGITTLILSACKTLAFASSFENLILENSQETAEGLLIWTTDQMRNQTAITDPYSTELNPTTFSMGAFGLISNLCWNVQVDCYKDVIFWIAKYNESQILALGEKVKGCLATKMQTGKQSLENDEQCWDMYRKVKEVDSLMNDKLYLVLLITHLYSFMTFSYFLTFLLNEQAKLITILVIGYNAVKGALSYIPGRRSSGENELFRKWIQTLPCGTNRFCVGGTPYTREIMLWELEKEPLGLGKGKLHVNNEFLCTFITLVVSLFCFLLNIENKNEEVRRF